MTEIKIEKKKPIWPWILLLLGLLSAVWFFFFRNDKVDNLKTEDTEVVTSNHQKSDVVAEYVTFITTNNEKMSLDHEFTNEALIKLINAVEAKAAEANFDIKADLSKAKMLAEDITKDPMSTTHADKIRDAADLLSTAMQNLQKAKYNELSAESAEVKSAAAAIDPKTLTLDQREAVKSFFRKSADLLSKMN